MRKPLVTYKKIIQDRVELFEYPLTVPTCYTLMVKSDEWRIISIGSTFIAENQATKELVSRRDLMLLVSYLVDSPLERA